MRRSALLLGLLVLVTFSAPAKALYSEVDLGNAGGDTHLELLFRYDDVVAFISGESAKRNNENDSYHLMNLALGYQMGDFIPFIAYVRVSEEHYRLELNPISQEWEIVLHTKNEDVLSIGVRYRKTLDKLLLSGTVNILEYGNYTGHYFNAECGHAFFDGRYYATVGYSEWKIDKSAKFGGLEIGAKLTF